MEMTNKKVRPANYQDNKYKQYQKKFNAPINSVKQHHGNQSPQIPAKSVGRSAINPKDVTFFSQEEYGRYRAGMAAKKHQLKMESAEQKSHYQKTFHRRGMIRHTSIVGVSYITQEEYAKQRVSAAVKAYEVRKSSGDPHNKNLKYPLLSKVEGQKVNFGTVTYLTQEEYRREQEVGVKQGGITTEVFGYHHVTPKNYFSTYQKLHDRKLQKSLFYIRKPSSVGRAKTCMRNSQALFSQHVQGLLASSTPLLSRHPYEANSVLQKNLYLQYLLESQTRRYFKVPLKTYDKVFYYYSLQTPLTMYAHKAFILLEMQLNASLIRTKIVPYLFMARDLCFYRLVQLNQQVAKNPHQILSLYDSLSIPVHLHNYMYYRQYRLQYYPQVIGAFFKRYWTHFTNYSNNKAWLLTNFVTSDITAEAITFDYPNILLYMGPFRRFTKLYYKNHPYAPTGNLSHWNNTHAIVKLKLFEYAAFYR